MNEKSSDSVKTRICHKYTCTAPLLFGFSLGDYSDELQKQRNRKLYMKLKEVEKKLLKVKNQINQIAVEHIGKLRRKSRL
jgi:hypothetical protein